MIPSIEFKNVTKSFGDRRVLNSISFQIFPGQIFFILGVSGTGKSVTLKTLVGLLRADGGQIWVDGQNITDISEAQYLSVRKNCGMVFQQPALFDSLTVFENVAFGVRKHNPEWSESEVTNQVRTCLDLVHLANIEKLLPNQISFGMQKRVSLARTIAVQPRILLFDEPTTGLDPVTTNAINRLIKDLSRHLKTTSLIVSHDMHCALDIADQILVLDGGKILAQGSPKELIHSENQLVQDFLAEAKLHRADRL